MEKIEKIERDTNNKDIVMVSITKTDDVTNKEEKFVRHFDLNTKRDLDFLNELMIANGLRKAEEPKVEEKPKKKHTVAKVLFAGAVLLGLYKAGEYYLQNNNESPTNNGTVPVVDVVIVKVDKVTKEELQTSLNEVVNKLTIAGYENVDSRAVLSALVAANIERIDDNVVMELKNENLINENGKEIVEDSFDILGRILPANTDSLLSKKDAELFSLSNFIIGEDEEAKKDRELIVDFENEIIKVRDVATNEEAQTLGDKVEAYLVGDDTKKSSYREELTEGAEFLVTQIVAREFTGVAGLRKLGIDQDTLDNIETSVTYVGVLPLIDKACGVETISKSK